jgi:hypothetical protein
MNRAHLAILGVMVLALAAAGCGEQPTSVATGPGPQLATPPDENVILRGDVGDFVWFDQNDNGMQDDGAMSGVNGVDVIIECIRSLDGSLWTMTFTTANSPQTGLAGWYNFNSVPAGSCTAYLDPATVPSDLMISPRPCGGPLEFIIGEGPTGNNNKNIDFCLIQRPLMPGAIGDFVWCDLNDDGIQDPGEPGVPGVVVNLMCSGGHTDSQMTDADGLYLFTGVPAGMMCTVSVDPASFPPDKMPGTNCPTVRTLTLAEGETNLEQDFCLIEIPPPPGDEGCTPGYWKNHPNAWSVTGYSQLQMVQSVFGAAAGYGSIGTASLREALAFNGGRGAEGAARILLRAAVASLLNAAHPDVDFPWSGGDITADVNEALDSGDRDTMLGLASQLDWDNNLGCPLN